MLKSLLLGALLLASCAPTRPDVPGPQHATPVALYRPPADSLPQVVYPAEDRPGLDRASSLSFFGKIWRPRHRQPAAETVAVAPGTALVLPKKMRHSQLTVVVGNGNSTKAAQVGKIKAPAQLLSDSSTQNTVTDGGNVATVQGDGNTLAQTDTRPPKKGLLQTLWDGFKPALLIGGGALGVAGVVLLLTSTPVGPLLVAAWKRRKVPDKPGA